MSDGHDLSKIANYSRYQMVTFAEQIAKKRLIDRIHLFEDLIYAQADVKAKKAHMKELTSQIK